MIVLEHDASGGGRETRGHEWGTTRARRLTDARARHFVTRDARATRIAMGVPSAEDVEFGEEKKIIPLDEDDIALLKTYGLGAYNDPIKDLENDLKTISKRVNDLCGIKESDTGLAPPSP